MDELAQQVADRLKAARFVEVEASGRHVHPDRGRCADALRPSTDPNPSPLPAWPVCLRRTGHAGWAQGETRPRRSPGADPLRLPGGNLPDRRQAVGVPAPIRLSGDIAGSPGITIEGDCGKVELSEGTIIAQRHIHMTPEDAARFQVHSGEAVKVKLFSDRPSPLRMWPCGSVPPLPHGSTSTLTRPMPADFQKGNLGMILT